MAVSVFPQPTTAGSSAGTIYYVPVGTSRIDYTGVAGIHTFKSWSTSYGGSVAPSQIQLYDSAENIIQVGGQDSWSLGDPDTGSGNNAFERSVRSTGEIAFIVVVTTTEMWLQVGYNNQYSQGTVLNTQSYSTSQSITFSTATRGVIIGGGGGGGAGSGGGGGGGGSGYRTPVTILPGTYALVVGAGGTSSVAPNNGGTGGTTTFNGFSAVGGQGGRSNANGRHGGAGGSGGGAGSAGAGGFNGANGVTVGTANGGLGSGQKLAYYATPGQPGGGGGWDAGNGGGGGGGGLYAGGGAGNNGAGAGGGGGGGGGLSAGAGGQSGNVGSPASGGGAGGAGGMIVLV